MGGNEMGKTGVFGKSAGAVIAIAVAMCALCAGLAGCATQNSGNVTSEQDENSAVEKATIATRTVTFPALFFQDTAAEDVQANLQKWGCTDIVANEDGSYTATMPIDKYNELVDSWHDSTAKQLDEMPNSETWSTITAVDYDEQFSQSDPDHQQQPGRLSRSFRPVAGS